MFFNRKKITTDWFFSSPHPVIKPLGIYVKGDGLVLVPFLLLLGVLFFFSVRVGCLVTGLFFAIRGLGEMVYWLLQQFGPKTYRSMDFGLKHVNNEGIYILYQLIATVQATIGAAVALYIVMQ